MNELMFTFLRACLTSPVALGVLVIIKTLSMCRVVIWCFMVG